MKIVSHHLHKGRVRRTPWFVSLLLAIFLLPSNQAAATTKRSLCAHPPRTPFTYHWPVKPFDREHPIRGAFGDPRTVNLEHPFGWTGPLELGAHSFHNGVDIVAGPGTPVYPVVSGQVVVAKEDKIVVRTRGNRSFQYYHLLSAVRQGQRVVVDRTVLGWIQAAYRHVHLAEIDGGRVHNPLDPGHLEPYRDRTTPRATRLYVDDGPQPFRLQGGWLRPQDQLAVAAGNLPAMALPRPWLGLPQTPALVEWRLFHDGRHGRWKIAADFRKTEPGRRDFWRVYGPGTYQNFPVFSHHLYRGTHGLYLFRIGPHPNHLSPGLDQLQVRVAGVCGNHSTTTWPLAVG
ncbi:MAG TPA: M23 family metallopeptidase [Gaiellaceae bacterium]|nr:M23 family metallopeptidase [Gaiellaceae bacterium]